MRRDLPDARVSLVVEFADGSATATIAGGADWKRRIAAEPESDRVEMLRRMRADAHRGLDDLFHLLAFVEDPEEVEKLRPDLAADHAVPRSAGQPAPGS